MRPFSLSLVAILTAAAHGQQTWTVPTDAPTLQAAIDAAQPGDTITMTATFRDAGSIVLRKALTLVDCRIGYPDGGFGLRVVDLAGGARLELRNVSIAHVGDGFLHNASTALRIELPALAPGALVFDGVQVTGPVNGSDTAALRVVRLGNATLTARACAFFGKPGGPLLYQGNGERGPVGGDGAVLAAGKYLFEDCVFVGGRGGFGYANAMTLVSGESGGAALVASTDVVLVRCTLTDGDGGDALAGNPPPAFPPADPCAIAAQPGVSQLPADLFDVIYQPGRIGDVSGCSSRPPQPPVQVLGRATDVLPTASTFTTGQPVAVQFTFMPTDTAALFAAGLPLKRTVLPGILGPVWMEQIAYSVLMTPPTPGATVAVPLPSVPPGLVGPIEVVLQALHGSNVAPPQIGAPRVVTIRP